MGTKTDAASTKRALTSSRAGLATVLASVALSAASYGRLPETVRIRWTVGTYQQYGPERISTLFVLVAFPVLVAGLYLGVRRLGAYLERTGEMDAFDEFRITYDVFVLFALAVVVACQLVVVALNL